jgi:hypothetical protein
VSLDASSNGRVMELIKLGLRDLFNPRIGLGDLVSKPVGNYKRSVCSWCTLGWS